MRTRLSVPVVLSPGGHIMRSEGTCLMEAVAYLAGEMHSDRPACVSPVIAMLGRLLNDGVFRHNLDELAPYAARLLDTNRPEREAVCAQVALHWLVQDILPLLLPPLSPEWVTELAARVRKGDWQAARWLLLSDTSGAGDYSTPSFAPILNTLGRCLVALRAGDHESVALNVALCLPQDHRDQGEVRKRCLALLDRLICVERNEA